MQSRQIRMMSISLTTMPKQMITSMMSMRKMRETVLMRNRYARTGIDM
ncbi:MAG: hypothetical protein LIO96_10635 [Lachnospiraceae bacterium]|nr:hypothetical protein [Lachnospiraceae bacterium]